MISILYAFIILIVFQFISKTTSFYSKRLQWRSLSKFNSAKPPDWQEDSSMNRDSTNDIKISQDFVQLVDAELGSMISSLTIDTVTYYMLEFRNDVVQRWMINFANYSASGFPNNDWTEYIEKMIKSNDEKIQVIMKPPQNVIRGNMGPNMAIQYDFDVGKLE